MTKVGLVSDSHGLMYNLKSAVRDLEAAGVDLIVHTGDHITDADVIKSWVNIPVMAVRGNMDSEVRDRPDFIKTTIDGMPTLIVHGHYEGVKYDTDSLVYKALANDCKLAIYGHTHIKDLERKDGVIVVNPGSVSLPHDSFKSYAILTLDNGEFVDCQFYEVQED